MHSKLLYRKEEGGYLVLMVPKDKRELILRSYHQQSHLIHLSRDRLITKHKYILVCVDFFTNWIEACPLTNITANEVLKAFFQLTISRHGCPTSVLTDQGNQFTAQVFQKLLKEFGIVKLEGSAYHKQTNGKTERFNRFLENSLSTVVNSKLNNWDDLINDCLFTYRISLSRSLQETTFFLIYGRDPVLPTDLTFPT
jgi:transposase InsO family protein